MHKNIFSTKQIKVEIKISFVEKTESSYLIALGDTIMKCFVTWQLAH